MDQAELPTRERVVNFHNSKIEKINEIIEDWLKPGVKDFVGADEWQKIYDGLQSDKQEAIDYTNDWLEANGLELL